MAQNLAGWQVSWVQMMGYDWPRNLTSVAEQPLCKSRVTSPPMFKTWSITGSTKKQILPQFSSTAACPLLSESHPRGRVENISLFEAYAEEIHSVLKDWLLLSFHMEDVQMVPYWVEEYRKFPFLWASYEQLTDLSTGKRLGTGGTREKKMIPNTINCPAKVTEIRHTDHGDVPEDTVLQDSF